MTRSKQKVHDGLIQMSTEAFAEHKIREEAKGRWLLQRHKNEYWDNTFWAEIVTMRGGIICINGDIELVSFAYYSGDEPHGLGILSWMGMHTDWRYIVEKASLGMTDGRALTTTWEEEVAREDIREDLQHETEQEMPNETMIAVLRDAIACPEFGTKHGMLEAIHDILRDNDYDTDMEFAYGYGVTIAPRVFYAHAALHRLCVLLQNTNRLPPVI